MEKKFGPASTPTQKINVAELLNGNYILLLFVVLALGLCLGKLRLGSIQLGNSIGVLVVSLLLGQQHFSINTDALNLGFMLFISGFDPDAENKQ
ncbi:hypothetical protein ACUOFC_34635, partial [Escherichia sp. TWPC-MK]